MTKSKSHFKPVLVTLIFFISASSFGAESEITISSLQTRWAMATYELKDNAKLDAYETLQADAARYTEAHPDDADGWIWSGIIKSTYAGARGGLGALGLAKAARDDLEVALTIDDQAMSGSAYTSLGTLYSNVPGWPLGFGSDKRAEQMLLRGLEINPDGLDSNYFVAEFLREKDNFTEARSYYIKASAAAPRPDQLLADRGRKQEIELALSQLDAE